ncbi:UTP--glucose-1-phosphate uridylyltransferase AglF [uncultured archaeon]|nr:UTP--glucose-1-phosphate uridylyltransferase AglF [uncultured archaeon]
MKALILAGGRGSRLNHLTKEKNKSMLRLFEKPLIEYNLEHAATAEVSEIIIVVGYRKEDIIRHYGHEFKGIKITYVVQKEQRGLVNAIECAREKIGSSDFILMLADEMLVNPDLKGMIKKFKKEELFAICGVTFEEDKLSIGKTYSAMYNEKGRVFRQIEKPRDPINKLKGTGHCIIRNEMLDYIERTPINANRGEKELVDWIQVSIDEGKKVYVYHVTKNYVNVNTEEDYNLSKEMIRKNNPRVLIVHTQMKYFGGAELLVVELANWLTKKGVKNDILALSKSKEVENLLINSEIIIPKHNINLEPPGFKSTKEILQFIKIYRKEIKRLKKHYDVINFHNFPVTWTLFPSKKPCVWMLNEPPNLWSRPNAGIGLKILNKLRNYLDREIIRSSVDIICVADEFNKERCITRYKKNPRLVYYGVNHEFFSGGKKENAIKKFNLDKKFIVVQSGMITEQKNQLESIKTIQKVKETIPNVLLVIAGKPSDEEYMKQINDYIKKNKLEKYVLFTGNLGREDLRDLYKAANVGLFPIGKQGGWLAPFELLCSGNPIIVSEELGAASVVKKWNLGTVTSNYSDELINVYKNQNEFLTNARAASLVVKKNLGWDIFADNMIEAYKEAWKR